MLNDLMQVWRVFNILGAVVSLVSIYLTVRRTRGIISRRSMCFVQALFFAHAGIILSSIEGLMQGEPLLPRTALSSAVVGWTLLGLYFPKAVLHRDE